jgi:hypothetical protein
VVFGRRHAHGLVRRGLRDVALYLAAEWLRRRLKLLPVDCGSVAGRAGRPSNLLRSARNRRVLLRLDPPTAQPRGRSHGQNNHCAEKQRKSCGCFHHTSPEHFGAPAMQVLPKKRCVSGQKGTFLWDTNKARSARAHKKKRLG